MLSYILVAILSILLWEVIKDALDLRNIFNKYDGLSSKEELAIKMVEEQEEDKEKGKETSKQEFIDD